MRTRRVVIVKSREYEAKLRVWRVVPRLLLLSCSTRAPFARSGDPTIAMASFFDNKARAAAAAANGASSSKAAAPKETQNLQPWVEK